MSNTGFNKDTEVLTYGGWKNISEIEIGESVIGYNIEEDILIEDQVLDVVEKCNTPLLEVTHKEMSFTTSPDHRWYGWKRMWAKRGQPRGKKYYKFSISEATQDHQIINSAKYKHKVVTDSITTKYDLAFLAWVLSDGYYKWSSRAEITSCAGGKRKGVIGMVAQAQHKFYREVEEVINKVGIQYTMHEDTTGVKTSPVNKYHFRSEDFRNFMDRVVGIRMDKANINWIEVLLRYDSRYLEDFLYHFWLADGDTKGIDYTKPSRFVITQNKGHVCDAVSMLTFFRGNKTTVVDKDGGGKCKQIRSLKRRHSTLQEVEKTNAGTSDTYDILTSTGMYVIRQGVFMSITCSSSFNLSP